MKAPEKIYLFENPITETPDERWLTHRSCEEDIEYTHTDAFIEKACDVLDEILEHFLHGGDSSKVIALFQEKMEEEK